MPKLTENVLIGGQVRLAGEDISEADARGIRPEVFEKRDDAPVDGRTPAGDQTAADEQQGPAGADDESGDEDAADAPAGAADEPAEEKKETEAPKSGRRGSSSRK